MTFSLEHTERIEELSDYERGFIDSALHRLGVVGRRPTAEEFTLALFELEDFIDTQRQGLRSSAGAVASVAD